MAVMGERELALAMMDYALRSSGINDESAKDVVAGFRTPTAIQEASATGEKQ